MSISSLKNPHVAIIRAHDIEIVLNHRYRYSISWVFGIDPPPTYHPYFDSLIWRLTSFTQVSSKDGHHPFSPSIIFTTTSKYPDPPTFVMTTLVITSELELTSRPASTSQQKNKTARVSPCHMTIYGNLQGTCFSLTVLRFSKKNVRDVRGCFIVVFHLHQRHRGIYRRLQSVVSFAICF